MVARVWRPAVLGYALVLAAVLTGCGSVPVGDPVSPESGVEGVPMCDAAMIRADEALYRDTPVYGNASDLIEEVQAWAPAQPGFVELWLDRERGGWITIGVKGADVAALQAEAASRWPGEGIVVVEVPWTIEELGEVGDEIEAALREAGVQIAGYGLQASSGRVEIDLGVITPEGAAVLAGFAGRPVCVNGTPADDAPEEKPQPTAGEGWRLLGDGLTGESYRTGVATTHEQLGRLWDAAGMGGEPPSVDWQTEIVVWFGAVYGSGCPVRMDGVMVADDLVYADLVVPGAVFGCPSDANPHAFVVAVARDLLPRGPFRVQLEARDPYPGAPEERTVVDADLSAPGSVATDEQVHLDAALMAGVEPPLVTTGDALPDGPVRYAYRGDPSCSTPVLGPLDGSVWRLADREAPWTVADGEEIGLYPLDGWDSQLVASSPQGDWMFVRLPDGRTCP